MQQRKPEIFLDTSVIIAALFSETGGARMLFRLGEAGVVTLVVGKITLQEADEVLLRKAPDLRVLLAQLLDTAQVKIGDLPTKKYLVQANAFLDYAPNAQVLAEAMQATPDWFVSHDREHFLDNPGLANLPFQIGSPGDILAWFRTQLWI